MSIKETAEELEISPHTLKNWLKRDNRTLENFQLSPEERRLTKGANKKNSRERLLPRELMRDLRNRPALLAWVERLEALSLGTDRALLLFLLLLLRRKGFLAPLDRDSPLTMASLLEGAATHPVLHRALSDFFRRLPPLSAGPPLPRDLLREELFPARLLKEPDLPGLIYQTLRLEGNKIRHGAYFTPRKLIRRMLHPYRSLSPETKFLDPCCGSGMFLCSFAEMTGRPELAGGMDKDPAAVLLSRINLFLRFPEIRGLDHIRLADALLTEDWDLIGEVLIATNPPWGAHYTAEEKRRLGRLYAPIRPAESFALFLSRAVRELPVGGKAAFLLPESLLYVGTHREIRRQILREAPPFRIVHLGRIFRGVYTPVIRMDLHKGRPLKKCRVRLKEPGGPTLLEENQPQRRYRENRFSTINIHCSNRDAGIVKQLRRGPSGRLGPDCRWILGTVTGDNRRFLTDRPGNGAIPVLSGKEIRPYRADPPRLFIRTDAGNWQQSRGKEEYRPGKIVYTFIGVRPSFAVDRTGTMTLNSANCLIPGREQGLEELAAWFNSSLFRFLWRKEFHSLKLLRGHLEELPLPRWDPREKEELTALVKEGENRQDIRPEIDGRLFDLYGISSKDRHYVCSEDWL